MADTYVAVDADRLPWLTDDVERPKCATTTWVVAFLAASSVAIIAALSFWLGMSGAAYARSGSSAKA